jgi:hypothetical protein
MTPCRSQNKKSHLLPVIRERQLLVTSLCEPLGSRQSPPGEGSIIGKVKSVKILYHNNGIVSSNISNFGLERRIFFTFGERRSAGKSLLLGAEWKTET